jgi:hypothetical protein
MPPLLSLISSLLLIAAAPQAFRPSLADRVSTLSRESEWTLVRSIPVRFDTYHPQGMVKIGDAFFVSSVEVRVRTARHPAPVDGHDRTAGEGRGHLFKIGGDGALLGDLALGEGTIYHPGGIDFDGRWIWVPVAEYRPDSRSIVYRVDPRTLTADEVLRFPDHIGGIVHDTEARALHGVSWGSRRFYRWPLGADGRVAAADVRTATVRRSNPSHYIDYQDCKYAGGARMLCTGVSEIRIPAAAAPVRLGGMDLVDLADGRPVHQVPVLLWTAGGLDMTHNPAWIEPADLPGGPGLRAWFMPEDGRSTIYVYEVRAR